MHTWYAEDPAPKMKPRGKLLRLRLPISRIVEASTAFVEVIVNELITNIANMATMKSIFGLFF
jgi:hypothetical protein